MGTFLVYILKSAVCLAMFYLFYRLLLSKETFHRFNRMALLGVMLLSCLLPLVKVTVEQASPVNAQVMSMEDLLLMYQWNSEAVVVEEGSRPFHWQEGLVLVYFAGLFFVILRHLWVSIRPTTGIKPLYTTIATVTMNLIVSAAIVLLNPYVTIYISYKIPPFALSVHIPDVSTSIYVEVDSKVLLGLPFCDKAFVR